jgi:hypothetical protein
MLVVLEFVNRNEPHVLIEYSAPNFPGIGRVDELDCEYNVILVELFEGHILLFCNLIF